MRDPVAPLGNARFDGFCQIREIGPLGMISLRAKADVKSLAKAIKAAVGTKLPAQRRIEVA
ncbi:MAG: sarcosine oxidase subunit gamma, partial [Paracoccaceae bacterium]